MAVIVAIFLAAILIYTLKKLLNYLVAAPITTAVKGDCREDLVVPYAEPVELYFADISACSMKARMCLAEGRVRFKANAMKLPSAGSFETTSPEFLRINPAGTVPVLIHNGHPVYESGEQILYIARNLVSVDGPELLPTDPVGRAENEYWVSQTTWNQSEISNDMIGAFKLRPANCVLALSMPSFAAIGTTFTWKTVLRGMFLGGWSKKLRALAMPIIGVKTFKYIPGLASTVKKAKKAMLLHLKELEEFLRSRDTKFICGNQITLADIGWSPILERLDFAKWWEHINEDVYVRVFQYWRDLKDQPSYREATRRVLVEDKWADGIQETLGKWKQQYPWFKEMYESNSEPY